jgi:hypothetical protein
MLTSNPIIMKPASFFTPVPFINRLLLPLLRRFSGAPSFRHSNGKLYVSNRTNRMIGGKNAPGHEVFSANNPGNSSDKMTVIYNRDNRLRYL